MDLSEIAGHAVMPEENLPAELPEIIPDSELIFDADIACYVNSWPEQALSTDIKNLRRHIEVKRLMAGCEYVRVYTTNGGKAGREDIAKVKKYQVGRSVSDPAKKARVEALRAYLRDYRTKSVLPEPQWEIEADDAMSIRQRENIEAGRVSKIMTVDKDLDMVPGIHINYETYEEIEHPDGYGEIWIEKRGLPKSKGGNGVQSKVKGKGTSFFWAQLLMGDGADDIPGLPLLQTRLLNRYRPTKETAKLLKANTAAAKKKLAARKPMGIGPVVAFDILKGCTTDKEALKRVTEAYKEHYGPSHKFTSWDGVRMHCSSGEMLIEQARLLWMLRWPDDDVLKFITEVSNT